VPKTYAELRIDDSQGGIPTRNSALRGDILQFLHGTPHFFTAYGAILLRFEGLDSIGLL